MKANIENLVKVVAMCAKAHNVTFEDLSKEDDRIDVHSDSAPVLFDMMMIADAFFTCGSEGVAVKLWGYTTILYPMDEYWRDEVDMDILSLALPYGALDNME